MIPTEVSQRIKPLEVFVGWWLRLVAVESERMGPSGHFHLLLENSGELNPLYLNFPTGKNGENNTK